MIYDSLEFEIHYTNKDSDYIKDVINGLEDKYREIMNFFGIRHFKKKLIINIWDSCDKYREYYNKKMKPYNKEVGDWEVGRSIYNKDEFRIDVIGVEEARKCKGHDNYSLDNFIKVIIHEFVHSCHFQYRGNNDVITWIAEALATNLSNQYDNLPIYLDVSFDDIMNKQVNYCNYYAMGNYLLNACSCEYVLKLAKDDEFLKKESRKVYDDTLLYLEKVRLNDYDKVSNPLELLNYMNRYIRYGIKDDNGNIYKWEMDDFIDACFTKWKFRDGLGVIKSGFGHCFDQTEIERDWFSKKGYEIKTLFIVFQIDRGNPYICHTYLVYKDNNKWNWFEHADNNNRGIHSFSSLEEAVLCQKKKHIEFNRSLGLPINDDIINTIHVYEYEAPKYGCSNQEFLDNVFDNGKEIVIKKR